MNANSSDIQIDVDVIPRPVVAFRSGPPKTPWERLRHDHAKAQLMYSVKGIINIEVEDGVWIVPPQCAVWIPSGLTHTANGASGETECYCLFVSEDAAPDLPKACCTLSVSPLLRELLFATVEMDGLYALNGREGRLIATLLDELVAAPIEETHLPMPRDERLRELAEHMMTDPGDRTTLPFLAVQMGMSERSLSRIFLEETGLTFGKWRRQLHIIVGLQRLSKGQSVQAVALDLGYENASGFVTMFRKAFGKPPASYLAERNRTPHSHDGTRSAPIRLTSNG